MKEKGWTITYVRWDDDRECIAGRFKSTKEKDDFLDRIYRQDSGWTPEEICSICIINDYNYVLHM